jgi:hypothetical protein
MADSTDTASFVKGRERVLGGQWVHRDPELAARMLADILGVDEAVEWAHTVLEHLAVA